MQKTHTPDKIAERLRVQPSRHNRKQTTAALVRTYYEEIRAARSAPGHLAKTWPEIAQDLSTEKPILAGTVSRAYNRVRSERGRAGTPSQPSQRRASTVADAKKTSDLFSTTATASTHPTEERRSPFGHRIDTIGMTNSKTEEA